jgi:hypothetical protein
MARTPARQVQYETEYGMLTVRPETYDGTYRLDLWLGKEPGDRPIVERCFSTGPQDTSPRQARSGYDPRCACCWLNFTHSEDYHRQEIAEAEAVKTT